MNIKNSISLLARVSDASPSDYLSQSSSTNPTTFRVASRFANQTDLTGQDLEDKVTEALAESGKFTDKGLGSAVQTVVRSIMQARSKVDSKVSDSGDTWSFTTKQKGYGRQGLYADGVYIMDVFPNVEEHFDIVSRDDAFGSPSEGFTDGNGRPIPEENIYDYLDEWLSEFLRDRVEEAIANQD